MSRGIAVLFLGPQHSRWGWEISPTPRPPLPPLKTRYPLYRRLGRNQGRSRGTEILIPTGTRSRTVYPVAQSLYRLSYPAPIVLVIWKIKMALSVPEMFTNFMFLTMQSVDVTFVYPRLYMRTRKYETTSIYAWNVACIAAVGLSGQKERFAANCVSYSNEPRGKGGGLF